MAERFLNQLDEAAIRELLERTSLDGAMLLTVGATLHIEDSNDAARALTGLRPMERIDSVLSESAVEALRNCIANHTPCTLLEELDGVVYRLELLPHQDGALLAFLHDGRSDYDGSLRVLQARSTQYLGTLLLNAQKVSDPELSASLRQQCMRLYRMLTHSDLLHDPPVTEQLRLTYHDLSEVCHEVAGQVTHHSSKKKKIALSLPQESYLLPVEIRMVRAALYNLLCNAMRVTREGGEVSLSLRYDGSFCIITIADRGPGMDAGVFATLLSSWRQPVSLRDYLALVRQGVTLGLGLPLAQLTAQLHGGSLLLSPRSGGGSELHFSIARLPDRLASNNLCAPMPLEDGFSLEEIELSVLD